MMKTLDKYIVAFLLIAFSSCSFLEEDPQSFVQGKEYFNNVTQCRSVVNSTYTQLRQVFNKSLWMMLEGTSDVIFQKSTADVNAIMEISTANCKVADDVWTRAYKMIMYANSAVEGIAGSPIEGTDRNALIAEAKIMRAFWYYHLTSLFGDVPFYFDDVTDKETLEKIARLPRMSAVDTRTALINDLREEITYDEAGKYTGALPMKKASEMEHGRAGWAMGEMLIAKMALWNASYDENGETDWYGVALEALRHIEEVYGVLSQYPLDDLLFRKKNTPEVIFEIQHTFETGGLSYVSNLASICMPSYNSKNQTYDGVSVPELGTKATVGIPSRPTIYFCSVLQPNTGVDERAKLNMAWDYNDNKFSGVQNRPWMGPKFWCPYMLQTEDHNNYPIFRYADAVLMMAECYMAKQDEANFLKYLNMVKTRAGLPEYGFTKWSKAEEELQDERARELFGEFQRKYDLVRWGIWYERVKEYSDFEKLKETVKPCHEFLPIPDKQVIYSDYALDNDAYKKYGL